MKAAGFCSLYREFHYIAIRYNEVWVYYDMYTYQVIPKKLK